MSIQIAIEHVKRTLSEQSNMSVYVQITVEHVSCIQITVEHVSCIQITVEHVSCIQITVEHVSCIKKAVIHEAAPENTLKVFEDEPAL